MILERLLRFPGSLTAFLRPGLMRDAAASAAISERLLGDNAAALAYPPIRFASDLLEYIRFLPISYPSCTIARNNCKFSLDMVHCKL